MREMETGNPKGYAFIDYSGFEASDAAIEAMNGQYLMNRPLSVSYALKKDGSGERHGTPAERLLAAQLRQGQHDRPHTMFAEAPAAVPHGMLLPGVPPMPPTMPPRM